VKGKVLKWKVDSDRFSLCDIFSNLVGEITWGSCKKPKIWMFDKKEGRDVEIVSESQILDMFSMYQKEKKLLLYLVVYDSDGSSKGSNTTLNYQKKEMYLRCTSSLLLPLFVCSFLYAVYGFCFSKQR
jgi:hypothetical protein